MSDNFLFRWISGLKTQSPILPPLVWTLSSLFVVGFGLAVVVFCASIADAGLVHEQLCFNSECVDVLYQATEKAFVIADATIGLLVSFSTIGGIFVALYSYLGSSKSSALANHIEHLKVFCDYLTLEVGRQDRLLIRHIDGLTWYRFMFPLSRIGQTVVSHSYGDFLKGLDDLIKESNSFFNMGVVGGFNYKKHQENIKRHLVKIGITTFQAPRNDYFVMEEQLFSLIQRISQSFCSPGDLPELTPREYY